MAVIPDHAFNLDARNRIEVHVQGGQRVRSFQVILMHDHSRFFGEDYRTVAMFDHNEDADADGHDVVEEGLHVDIYDKEGAKIDRIPPVKMRHSPRRASLDKTVRYCKGYLRERAKYLVDRHLRGE